MNKISKQNLLTQRFKQLVRQIQFSRRWSGEERNTDEKPDGPKDQKPVNREKGVSNKKESVREESYFHKEEVKQLNDLKKKIDEDKNNK